MGTSEPLWMTRAAWRAILDGVIEPGAHAAGADVAGLRERIVLRDAWRDAQADGDRLGVWVTPEMAIVLAGLLDRHPELTRLLAD